MKHTQLVGIGIAVWYVLSALLMWADRHAQDKLKVGSDNKVAIMLVCAIAVVSAVLILW